METVDIKEIVDYLKSKITIIVLITLLVTILGVSFKLFVQVPKYWDESLNSQDGSTQSTSPLWVWRVWF